MIQGSGKEIPVIKHCLPAGRQVSPELNCMKITIHCGAEEIGGSCLELQTATTRILIDFGMPLVDEDREPFDSNILRGRSITQLKESTILPDIKGLYRDEPKVIDAILISHSHQDHYGLLGYANPEIPLYMSQSAKAMIEAANIFIYNKPGKINAKVVKPWRPFKIGDFIITPSTVNHSGIDALAFLVEADDKRIYYSGDFRDHGSKSILLENMLKNPPKDTGHLLLEGSAPARQRQLHKDEGGVEQRIKAILQETKNIVFLSCSSQDIDRIVSAYGACLQTGRTFVIDLYTAFILSKLMKVSKGIPQYDSDNIRIKFWKTPAESLSKAGYRDLLYIYNKRKIELLEIDKKRSSMLMLICDNSVLSVTLKDLSDIKGAKLIYSMYNRYLAEEFKAKCDKRGIEIERMNSE